MQCPCSFLKTVVGLCAVFVFVSRHLPVLLKQFSLIQLQGVDPDLVPIYPRGIPSMLVRYPL